MNGKKIMGGVWGGLSGGVVFGMLMMMMGMMPTIAKLVGSSSLVVGWMVHLIMSVVIGLFFVWWFGNRATNYGSGAGFGLLHGLIWWVLGPLTIMPIMLGMGLQFGNIFAMTNMLSLMGHLIYGVILGEVYVAVMGKKTEAMAQGKANI